MPSPVSPRRPGPSRAPHPTTRRPTLLTAAGLALLATSAAWVLTQSGPAPGGAALPPPPPVALRWLAPRRAGSGGHAAGAAATASTTAAPRLSLPSSPASPPLPVVSICAIVKDQAADLPEWLAWHAGLGVDHVWLYDHASSPPLASTAAGATAGAAGAAAGLAPFMASGFLTLVTAPPDVGAAHPSGRAQLWAYDDCLETAGRGKGRAAGGEPPLPGVADPAAAARVLASLVTTPARPPPSRRPDWLAFIDVDEFIMPTMPTAAAAAAAAAEEENGAVNASARGGGRPPPPADAVPAAVAAFAAAHPTAGAWALNWVLFGSSGHVARPPGGVLASYTACLPPDDRENTHVKTLARVDRTVRVGPDPHHFLYDKAACAGAVNGRGQVVPGGVAAALGPPAYAGLALHHYATKSRAEYGQKIARGSGMGNAKVWAWFDSVEARSVGVLRRGGGTRPFDAAAAFKKKRKRKQASAAAAAATPPAPPSAAADAEGDDFGDLDAAADPAIHLPDDGDDDDGHGIARLPVLGEEEEEEGEAGGPPAMKKKKKQHPRKKKAAAAWAAQVAALATLATAPPPTQAAILWAAYGDAIGDEGGGGGDPEIAGLRALGGRGILALAPGGSGSGSGGSGGTDLGARLRAADPALAAAVAATGTAAAAAGAAGAAGSPPAAAPLVLALSASANHCLDVRRSGLPRAAKLFARHIKVRDQAAALASAPPGGVLSAVGTPARVLALLDAGALSLGALRLLVLDVRRDAKQRTLLDLPETRGEVWALVRRGGVGARVVAGEAKVAVFDSSGGSGA